MTTFPKFLQFTQHRQTESILLHSGMIIVDPFEIFNILEELSSLTTGSLQNCQSSFRRRSDQKSAAIFRDRTPF